MELTTYQTQEYICKRLRKILSLIIFLDKYAKKARNKMENDLLFESKDRMRRI